MYPRITSFIPIKRETPGTDITFFDFDVMPEIPGNNTVTRTGLRVLNEQNLSYWLTRFKENKVPHTEILQRDNRACIDFEDFEGQRLSLVVDAGAGTPPVAWEKSPVPSEHQIRGLGPITMTIAELPDTDKILQRVMNMRPVREYSSPENKNDLVHVYEMGDGGAHAELHVAVRPSLPRARGGAGGVHHIAFRTPTVEQYDQWAEQLKSFGLRSSGKVNRYYFQSLYFREPNGILFEIATDEPGFVVDENIETLGESLVLPPFLEDRRAQILAGLKPLD